MKNIFSFLLLFSLLLIFGCAQNEKDFEADRPHDPWVFRSVMDAQPRMLTIALNDNLWASYSAQTGSLYKVWKGSVNFDGAVYTTLHGPQPSSLGNAWFENKQEKPFSIITNGKEASTSLQYRGHTMERGQVWLNYDLTTAEGATFSISERPEYVSKEGGTEGFERTFKTENVPSGIEVIFNTNIGSISLKSSVVTDGEWTVDTEKQIDAMKLSGLELDGRLKLNSNALTTFTTWFTKKPLYENVNKVEGAEEEEERPIGYRQIARSDCKTCHNTYVQTIGPAYLDVAKKYKNTDANVAMLVGKVKNGGSGVWGETVMSAHDDLSETTIKTMIDYIMSLDAEEEAKETEETVEGSEGSTSPLNLVAAQENVEHDKMMPGALIKVHFPNNESKTYTALADVQWDEKPAFSGIITELDAQGPDFRDLDENFAISAEGYINIPKDNNYVFRLISDDGSRMLIDNKEIINHDGLHGASPKDGEIALSKGYHPFRIEFFQGAGGRSLVLQWASFEGGGFKVIPATAYMHNTDNILEDVEEPGMISQAFLAGDGYPLEDMHPSYDIMQARPETFTPKVGGMDFLSDGRLVVSTWDAEGGVFIVDNVQSGDPTKINVKRIASGLAEPLGLKVVDDVIYVLQKQELTRLKDLDGDEIIDEYYTLSNQWRTSANFHEFAFGLVYKDDHFYATLATAINPGGASTQPQIQDRGRVVKINKNTGNTEFIAHGLRTPNGIGLGVDNEIFVADNQGDWLPACKILHVTKDAFFGSHSVDPVGTADMKEKPPVVWLPQNEIGNSPSNPSLIPEGIYKGQMTHGEVTHGGLKRVFVEKINNEYQGVVFRWMQGMEAGVNRHVWGPDNAVYIGGIGSTGNWRHDRKLWYGLQRIKYNEKTAFEMLAVRAKSNGLEIEMTQPLAEGIGTNALKYTIKQWWYKPTAEYGGPKMDMENLGIDAISLSEDRKKIFIELDGMKEGYVVYVKLPNDWTSVDNQKLWSTEAWYTMNNIPKNQPVFPKGDNHAANKLSDAEKADGWKLLFDGETTNGWRNYRKQTIGSSWIVKDGALMLNSKKKDDGGWQAADGGDIVTDKSYEDYELKLEWKISPCGNSGIIYNVVESSKYDYVWLTGPEMQVLDNTCHSDAKIKMHRAGDLYDMISCKEETVKSAGNWNQVRLIQKDGKVEHWLNGTKVVEFEIGTPEWTKMVAGSKFNTMADFGKAKSGHISLQDHGDKVWYRGIKIKELK